MKAKILLLLSTGAFFAACSSSPSSSEKTPASSEYYYDFKTPDPDLYDGKKTSDFRVMWYKYEKKPVGLVEKIDDVKGDTWNVTITVLRGLYQEQHTLMVDKKVILDQGIRVYDMVEYASLEAPDIRKIPAYMRYLPKMDIKNYDPQKKDIACKGKSLNDLVPKYQAYPWTEKYGYVRIAKIEIPDIGLWKIYTEGPDGYKYTFEISKNSAFNQQYYIGTVVELNYIDRKLDKVIDNTRAQYIPLITPTEYNNFLHGGDPNGPLVVAGGKTAEQAMRDGTFDWFNYTPDEGGSESEGLQN
jgi:hypothetical protein